MPLRCGVSRTLLFLPFFSLVSFIGGGALVFGQAKPASDVLILIDGEKLVGQLQRATGTSVTFKSDGVGVVTVDWSKIQEVQSARTFAVIPKNVTFRRKAATADIPQGMIALNGKDLTVTPASGSPKTLPVADSGTIIEEPVFQNAIERRPGILKDWGGTVTGALSVVQATQDSRSFNAAAALSRVEPSEDWLTRRNRTLVSFNFTQGTVSQPGSPELKTSIYHAGLERDEYFSSAWFGFGEAMLDHNFSQNLSLQQTYGGGAGWSALKRARTNLDLKVGVSYIRQRFNTAGSNQSLIGSTFEEDFRRVLPRGMVFTEQLLVTPAWNNTNAYSGTGNALLTMPVFKRLSSSLGFSNNYLHDPPAGFKKNSVQFTAGVSYSLR